MENTSQGSHTKAKPEGVARKSTKMNKRNSEFYVGSKNTTRWTALQHKHGFNTSYLFGDFVLKHMQRFVTDWENAYQKLTQTSPGQSQGITRFQWVQGIYQPFNAFGNRLPSVTLNRSDIAKNKAITMANDEAFFATLTGFDQNTQLSSSLGSADQQAGEGHTSKAIRRQQPSMVTCEINLDKQPYDRIYVGCINKPEFKKLQARLGFKSGLELGGFVLNHMEEMSRDWEYMYTMIDLTGQLGALNGKALRWGEWGVNDTDLKGACRHAFDLLMGMYVDVTQEISYMNLFPASGLSFVGVGETVTPENTNVDFLQQGNSEYLFAQSNIPLELLELGSPEVYDSLFYESDQNTFGASQSDMTSCVLDADELEFLSMI